MASNFCVMLVIFVIAGSVFGKIDEADLPDDFKELGLNIHKTCVEESHADEELIKKISAGEFEEDDKLKCFIKCCMRQMNVMDEHGVITSVALESVLPEKYKAPVKETVDHCIETTPHDDDLCEKGFNFLKCTHEKDPENFFFF